MFTEDVEMPPGGFLPTIFMWSKNGEAAPKVEFLNLHQWNQ